MKSSPADRNAPAAPAPAGVPFDEWGGKPLRDTIIFLMWPALVLIVIKLVFAVTDIKAPSFVLYVFALVYGFFLLRRLKNNDPEWLLGLFMLYLPFSAIVKVSIIPGLNATNILVLLGLYSLMLRRRLNGVPLFTSKPGTGVMGWWWFLSSVSVITAMVSIGMTHVTDRFGEIKSWMDQFFVFFVVINLIRDGKMARRTAVYMMLGTVFVLAMGFEEWLEKRDVNSLDKARLLGPQNQPNSFGAFLVYAVGPFIALFVNHLSNWRSWPLAVVLLVWARLLIASFSRGAYLGFAAGAVALGYARGKVFLACGAAALIALVVAVPEVVPESMQARLGMSTDQDEFTTPKIDTSSAHRLILWNAAIEMTKERPVLGFGFGSFPVFKGFYTETEVGESDNHNMYLFVASQMGLPALLAMMLALFRMGWLGMQLARKSPDWMARALGMGACCTVVGGIIVNMFGSRLGDLSVMAYVWFSLAVISHLTLEMRAQQDAGRRVADKSSSLSRGTRMRAAPHEGQGHPMNPTVRRGVSRHG